MSMFFLFDRRMRVKKLPSKLLLSIPLHIIFSHRRLNWATIIRSILHVMINSSCASIFIYLSVKRRKDDVIFLITGFVNSTRFDFQSKRYLLMSGKKENRTTNLHEMFLSENRCPFPMIAEHQEIERNEGIDVRSLSFIAAALKGVDPFNTEEIQIYLTEIRKGKCQRQKSVEMLASWRSLRASVQCLSVSCLHAKFSQLGYIHILIDTFLF